ncbi:ABC transporter permease [Pseudomonadota bacterium]
MKGLRLGLRQLKRDWRAGELTVLALAIIIAVASLTSVSFFTSRIHHVLQSQANTLLGGDLVFLSKTPISQDKRQQLEQLSIDYAETVEFPTMVIGGDNTQLVSLKAVSGNYPLRGRNRVALRLFGRDAEVNSGPAAGTVWAGSRLLTTLGVNVGDEVIVGDALLKISAVLISEPDQSGGMLFSIAPRLLMHKDDVAATGLVQASSRINFRLLMAGEASAIEKIQTEWDENLAKGQRLRTVKDARPEVRTALERSEHFLGLAALVSVLLAGAAVAMATRRFVSRHLDNCAVMRCLGAEQSLITQIYLSQMFVLGIVASLVGIALGYIAQWGLVALLAPLTNLDLPAPNLWPVILGLMTGMITLLGFAIPPILQLKNVPMLRVLRRDYGGVKANVFLGYGSGVIAFFILVFVQAQNVQLAVAVMLGLFGVVALLTLIAALLLGVLKLLRTKSNRAWHLGFVNISRRAGSSTIQMVGFSVGLMALLLLAVVRTDLLSAWEDRLPLDAPNRFLINIQPDQIEDMKLFFKEKEVEVPTFYPMVRARLTEINGKEVILQDFQTERGRRLARREFNVSWAADLPEQNRVVSGEWWSENDHGEPQLSVEEGLAKELGLSLGDTMTYNVGGQTLIAKVTSIRNLRWDSFRANFFVIAPPGVLDEDSASYISGFFIPVVQQDVLNKLVQRFPNITVLDVASIIAQIRSIIERVTLAVEYVFLFTVLAGLMVMYAAIYSTLDERIHESAILRTLGARRGQLLNSIIMEYAGLGLLSGLVAAITAGAVGAVVAKQLFELTYVPGPTLWLVGMVVGAVGVGIAGTLGTRFVINQPPLKTMRSIQ